MKPIFEFLIRLLLFLFILLTFWSVSAARIPTDANAVILFAGVLLTYPLMWTGRKILNKRPTIASAHWVTTFVHFGLGYTLGVPLVRALTTHEDWVGWVLPIPTGIGWGLVVLTGAASFIVVANLALRGFGAPFFIALSRKLVTDWLYARTRNPMVLAGLAFFLSLGIWFQSFLFIVWVLIGFTPALLFFVKTYEERELEIRFGASYIEYKSRTSMLFPRMRRHQKRLASIIQESL
jgi:protein-S-isoprenylcysteine O-methyltransferase Ste14